MKSKNTPKTIFYENLHKNFPESRKLSEKSEKTFFIKIPEKHFFRKFSGSSRQIREYSADFWSMLTEAYNKLFTNSVFFSYCKVLRPRSLIGI